MKDRKAQLILMVAASISSLVVGLTNTAQAADYSIGGGVGLTPDYEGSDDYEAVPIPVGEIRFDNGMFVQLQGLRLKANLIPKSWIEWLRAGPVYNYRSSRNDVDNDKVDDLKNVSDANDLGAFPQRDLHLDSIHPLEVRGMHEQSHTGLGGPRTDCSERSSGTEEI